MRNIQKKKNKPKLLAPKCLNKIRKILEEMNEFEGPVHRKVYTIQVPYFLNGEETGINYDNCGDITFKVEKINLKGEKTISVDKNRFEVLIVCEGSALLNDVEFKKGETALIPAYIGDVCIKGNGVLLRTYVNN